MLQASTNISVISSRRILAALALVVTVCIVVAGCGGGGDDTGTGSDGTSAEGRDFKIEFAMAGVPGDPFYTVIKNGARQAGEDMGVDVQYNETTQYDFQEQVRLIRTVIAKEPDAIVISDENPEVLDQVIKEAVDAGLPTMVINTIGEDTLEMTRALGYVGQDEERVGMLAGERLKDEGIDKLLCLNQSPGAASSQARVRGLEQVYGDDVSCVAVDQTNRTAATNAVEAALSDTDADGLFSLGVTASEPALAALRATGSDLPLAGIDLSPKVLEAIAAGEMLFTSDQQQFLQGYLPVVALTLYLEYGITPDEFIETGPSYVTKEDAQQVVDLSAEGIR
jgi:simple sugar transport system substrate-binding protein